MDNEDFSLVRDVLDSLEIAKRAHNLLPKLPSGMKLTHLHILFTI